MSKKREIQTKTNPFRYSDTNKRYYTYDYYLRSRYGGKAARIPLDCGFTCPNIDGTCGRGGCIYCSPRGSGEFSEHPELPLAEQYESGLGKLSSKWSCEKTIPYLQAHTNTYAPVSVLREKYAEALALPGAVGLSVATRADCLDGGVLSLLAETAEKTDLTVELGLQSSSDKTAAFIGRGHTLMQFRDGYRRLCGASERINVCVHVIFGLPDGENSSEDESTMLETIREVARLKPWGIKIHLLHVLRGTRLESLYLRGLYTPLEEADYVSLVGRALTLLPPETVVCRLTGDGMADELLAPLWSRKKTSVINDIDKYLYKNGLYEGAAYVEEETRPEA